MVEWFHLNGKQASITKTGNLSQLCDFIMRVSVDNFFPVDISFENIVKIIIYCEKITVIEFIIKLQ